MLVSFTSSRHQLCLEKKGISQKKLPIQPSSDTLQPKRKGFIRLSQEWPHILAHTNAKQFLDTCDLGL